MALTQSNLDALVAAWGTGTLRVTDNGRTIEYRSLAEMESVIASTAAALGVPNPIKAASSPRRYSFTTHRRG